MRRDNPKAYLPAAPLSWDSPRGPEVLRPRLTTGVPFVSNGACALDTNVLGCSIGTACVAAPMIRMRMIRQTTLLRRERIIVSGIDRTTENLSLFADAQRASMRPETRSRASPILKGIQSRAARVRRASFVSILAAPAMKA